MSGRGYAGPPGPPPPGMFPPPPPPFYPPGRIPTSSSSTWQEHISTDGPMKGKKYYFNPVTKQSLWEKPPELLTLEERADLTTPWREHTSPDGRKYYFNKTTNESRWVIPDEVKAARQQLAEAEERATNEREAAAKRARIVSGKGPDGENAVTWSNKDEAREAFKAMLDDNKVHPRDSWDRVIKNVMNDFRYHNAIKSVNERKAAFHEWCKSKERQDREEKGEARKKVAEAFAAALDECDALRLESSYARAVELVGRDPRWLAVPSEREREDLFQSYVADRGRRGVAAKQRARGQRMDACHALLSSCAWLDDSTTWRKASDRLASEPAFAACHPAEQLDVFRNVMKQRESQRHEAEETTRSTRYRVERQRRDAFLALMHRHVEQDVITPRMRFCEYVAVVKKDEAYKALCLNKTGSTPKELFDDVMESLEASFEREQEALRRFEEVKGIVLQPEGFESYRSAMRGEMQRLPDQDALKQTLAAVSDTHLRLAFEIACAALTGKRAKKRTRDETLGHEKRSRTRAESEDEREEGEI